MNEGTSKVVVGHERMDGPRQQTRQRRQSHRWAFLRCHATSLDRNLLGNYTQQCLQATSRGTVYVWVAFACVVACPGYHACPRLCSWHVGLIYTGTKMHAHPARMNHAADNLWHGRRIWYIPTHCIKWPWSNRNRIILPMHLCSVNAILHPSLNIYHPLVHFYIK